MSSVVQKAHWTHKKDCCSCMFLQHHLCCCMLGQVKTLFMHLSRTCSNTSTLAMPRAAAPCLYCSNIACHYADGEAGAAWSWAATLASANHRKCGACQISENVTVVPPQHTLGGPNSSISMQSVVLPGLGALSCVPDRSCWSHKISCASELDTRQAPSCLLLA